MIFHSFFFANSNSPVYKFDLFLYPIELKTNSSKVDEGTVHRVDGIYSSQIR